MKNISHYAISIKPSSRKAASKKPQDLTKIPRLNKPMKPANQLCGYRAPNSASLGKGSSKPDAMTMKDVMDMGKSNMAFIKDLKRQQKLSVNPSQRPCPSSLGKSKEVVKPSGLSKPMKAKSKDLSTNLSQEKMSLLKKQLALRQKK